MGDGTQSDVGGLKPNSLEKEKKRLLGMGAFAGEKEDDSNTASHDSNCKSKHRKGMSKALNGKGRVC